VHVLNYEIKRAHWQLTWWAIREFRVWGEKLHCPELEEMTAARYDLLFAIQQLPTWVERSEEPEDYEMSFGVLVQKLGLHKSTVSKCLKGLVELGLLTEHVVAHDRRKRFFRLTRAGFDAFHLAEQVLFGGMDEAFFEANQKFAHGAAWDEARTKRRVGEHDTDNMLLGFGTRARACATELGSRAWPIYDPDFEDPQLLRVYAWAA